MSVLSIDKELKQFWPKLTVAQKEAVLTVVKTYVAPQGHEFLPDETEVTIDEYNREIDEAMAEIDRGEFYTNEEVKKMFAAWDKKQLKRSSGVKGQ
jgi:hypothetical protein